MSARLVSFPTNARGGRPKYGNVKTVVDGIRFDSKKEAARHRDLVLLENAGRIRGLEHQVSYKLMFGDQKICTYRADFVYEEYVGGEWKQVVEDCKGMLTPVYRLKKKLMKVLLDIDIRES